MADFLAGYTIEEVRRIIDQSWSLWRLKYAQAPGVEKTIYPDAKSVISGFDLPNVNAMFEATLDPSLDPVALGAWPGWLRTWLRRILKGPAARRS